MAERQSFMIKQISSTVLANVPASPETSCQLIWNAAAKCKLLSGQGGSVQETAHKLQMTQFGKLYGLASNFVESSRQIATSQHCEKFTTSSGHATGTCLRMPAYTYYFCVNTESPGRLKMLAEQLAYSHLLTYICCCLASSACACLPHVLSCFCHDHQSLGMVMSICSKG